VDGSKDKQFRSSYEICGPKPDSNRVMENQNFSGLVLPRSAEFMGIRERAFLPLSLHCRF
ncbi:MAG: hypothetical protein KAH09_06375, partial [Desulfobacula sp.]|nr:hypothetical protein [Desulfobacula sp.]